MCSFVDHAASLIIQVIVILDELLPVCIDGLCPGHCNTG